ncbi:MAG: hypothetical protein ACXWC9_09265 [Pseudobdellovibrionaceae bacterium]
MKSSMLAILICLTGAFAHANEKPRLAYECDEKHGRDEIKMYQDDGRFFLCLDRRGPDLSALNENDNDRKCDRKVWSTDTDWKDHMLTIDFRGDWMFEGDRKSGVLWNHEDSFICRRPHHDNDHENGNNPRP